jgi:hypothetical protein
VTVAVLASPEDGLFLIDILKALAGVGVDAYGLKIHTNWKDLPRASLVARVDKASHFLVLATKASLASTWFNFAVGYGYSRRANFALCRSGPVCDMPRYISGFPTFDDLGELEEYYRIEKTDWIVQEERRMSRATLLELGVSVHQDSLAQCVRDGDTKAVELFVKAGFHPDSRDRHGVPLLCLAARGKHRAVAEFLQGRGAQLDLQSEDRGYSPLMDAVHSGATDLVAFFLGKGAKPDLASKDGQTALVVAVGRNDAEVVRLLVSAGADPRRADNLGLSARDYAALFKNPEILALLGLAPAAS